MQKVADIRKYFIEALNRGEFVTDKTGVKTIELVGASFLADETAIFGTPNKEYIDREIEWYASQSLRVSDIPGKTPAIWESVASKTGLIHSNYGYLTYSFRNGSQFHSCLAQLLANPNSRRAMMIYTRPSIQWEYNSDGMSDFICTNSVQYLIRDGRMHAVVQMRSNDVVFGYRNDYAWQLHILEHLVRRYNYETTDERVKLGDITWQVGSLHVYERHFDLVQ